MKLGPSYFPLNHRLADVPGREGLVYCEVCNAAEGELLSHCPGFLLNVEALEACYDGTVIDLIYWQMMNREPVLDYPPLSAFPDEL